MAVNMNSSINFTTQELQKSGEALGVAKATIETLTDGEITKDEYRNAMAEATFMMFSKMAESNPELVEMMSYIADNNPTNMERMSALQMAFASDGEGQLNQMFGEAAASMTVNMDELMNEFDSNIKALKLLQDG